MSEKSRINQRKLEKCIQNYSPSLKESLREISEKVDITGFLLVMGIVNLYEESVSEKIAEELCFVADFRPNLIKKAIETVERYPSEAIGPIVFEIGGIACERRYDLEEKLQNFGNKSVVDTISKFKGKT